MENEVKLHEIVFGKKWFERNQKALLFLLNTPPVSKIMRKILDIKENDDIVFIDPYEVCFSLGQNKFKREFHIARKYGYRLYSRFKYVWQLFHWYDMNFANRLSPKILNLGFDTLTVYPDAHTETYSTDGRVYTYHYSPGANVSVLADGVTDAELGGVAANDDLTSGDCAGLKSGDSLWGELYRGAFLFYTASLGAGASPTTATLSLRGTIKADYSSQTPNINIVSTNPNSSTTLVGNDFMTFGGTVFSTAIAYGDYSTTGYNDFVLNSAGKENISLTGVSKFGSRNVNYDMADTNPTHPGSASRYYRFQCAYADDTTADNGKDPKLVVEYTQAATFLQKHSMII